MMGAILVLVTLVLIYKERILAGGILGTAGSGFILLALWKPCILDGVYRRWMRFADILGRFNTKVLLGFFFLVAFPAVRFLMFVFRKDLLKKSFEPKLDSYWEERKPEEKNIRNYERQF